MEERASFSYLFKTAAIGLLACALTSCAVRNGAVEEPPPPYGVKPPVRRYAPPPSPPPPPLYNDNTTPPLDNGGSVEKLFNAAVEENRSGSQKALAMLEGVRRGYPSTVWAARASFLLGMHAINDSDAGAVEALALFKEAAPLTDIEDYITFYSAVALRRAGRPEEALASFDSISALFPDTALKPEILLQRSGALMDIGRFAEARDGFERFLAAHPKHALAPEALLGAAQASIVLGDMDGALGFARRLISSYPLNPASGKAEGLLPMIRTGSAGASTVWPTAQERLKRAEKFFASALYGRAVAEMAPLLKDTGSEYYGRAMLKTARSYMRLKKYARAEGLLKEYLRAKDPALEADALASLALIALRDGDERLLIGMEKRLSAKHPDSMQSAQLKIYLGRHFEDRDADRALNYYREVLDRFKATPYAEAALWSSGWLEYRAGRFDDARRIFSSYGSAGLGGAYVSRFLYWSARSAQKAGRALEARAGYEKLANGPGLAYYRYLALERLGRMGEARGLKDRGLADEGRLEAALAEDMDVPAGDENLVTLEEHYIEAVELLALGLNSRAASELEMLARRYSDDEDAIFEIARLYQKAGDYGRALRLYAERLALFKGTSKGGSRDYSSITFPRGIVELARKKARWLSSDPYMVAAVMREESAFNPKVVSTSGAVGLMQVMPSTGRLVAMEIGRGPVERADLFDPGLNIELGAWYLNYLSGRFNNDLVLTIAGYNAGPNAASRWAGTLPAETDEFIESIPYRQTRQYVKKVLGSYMEFKRLYGNDDPLAALHPSARGAAEAHGGKDDGES